MEESVRSSGIVKKKSSSGCLIIKKKGEGSGSGAVGGSQKRARVPVSEPGSSDDSVEYANRKMREHCRDSPPLVYARRSEEERLRRNGEFVSGDSKRSRLGLYDFDEYDEFDEIRMLRNDFGPTGSGGRSSRNVEHSYYNSPNGGARGRNKGIDDHGGNRKKRPNFDEEVAKLPASMMKTKYHHDSAEQIRLQGKNGVLKVMVNKKTKIDSSSSKKSYGGQEFESRKGSVSEGPFYSDSKREDVDRERSQPKLQKELSGKSKKAGGSGLAKNEMKNSENLVNSKVEEDDESDWADTTLKLAPPSLEAGGSSRKAVKKSFTPKNANLVKVEKKAVSPGENATPVKGVEGKLKQRGGSTEKQRLREHIRDMLMQSGWTIDYRPRRNRDYLDAVYINPNGTAYWSIIKAYDALQKQLQEDNDAKQVGVSSSFAPLADDLINKLTRQTRKKMEEEIKRKRKAEGVVKNSKKASIKGSRDDTDSDQNDVRLSSFVRQNGKPNKKGRFYEPKSEGGDDSSDNSGQEMALRPSATTSSVVHGRKSRKIGRCTLLIRGSEKGRNAEPDGYVAYTGKRTLLAWLIDSGTVQSSQKVQYMSRRRNRVKLEGWITKDGIHCGCCSKILTVLKFELHAGSKLRQPFQNILLESGASLMQCLVDAWNKQPESTRRDFYEVAVDGDDPDDDTCGRCGDGGDLICCDGCPSTFHLNCLGMEVLPPGDWHCPNCICKFCGTTSGCPTSENNGTSSELSWCNLCERKYHKSCTDGMDSPNANASNPSVDCCGKKCQESYDRLQKILEVKHELDSGFSWSLLQRTNLELDTAAKSFPQRVESNSKLAVALSVMDECFLPINDRRSGVNLIHNALYNCGSNFRRLDFRGFFTMVLERGDELIAAACIRIRGPQLAEMPFIGTRGIYRRQGMCRRLFSAIESVLCSLKIEKLIIPAVSEHLHTWTVIFGFKELKDSDKKSMMKSTNILVFPGTDLLQKQLLKQETPDAMIGFDSSDNLPQSPASAEKGGSESPSKPDAKVADSVESECDNKDEVKCDAPSSVDKELLSTSILDSKGKTLKNFTEDVESQEPVSVSANRDTMGDKKYEDADFVESPKPHAPAEVVPDDVILKDCSNNDIVEDRPSSQTTVSASVVEEVQSKQIFDLKNSVRSIETPGDDQARNDLRSDSVGPNILISEVSNADNDAGTYACRKNGEVKKEEASFKEKTETENGPALDTNEVSNADNDEGTDACPKNGAVEVMEEVNFKEKAETENGPALDTNEVSNADNDAGTDACPRNGMVEVKKEEASFKEKAETENGPALDTNEVSNTDNDEGTDACHQNGAVEVKEEVNFKEKAETENGTALDTNEVSNADNDAGTDACPKNGAVEVKKEEASFKEKAETENGPALDTNEVSNADNDAGTDACPKNGGVEVKKEEASFKEKSETENGPALDTNDLRSDSVCPNKGITEVSNVGKDAGTADDCPKNGAVDVEEPHSVSNSLCQENVEADLISENLFEVSENTQTDGTKSGSVADVSMMDVEEPHSVGNSSYLSSENLIKVSEDTQTEGTKSGSVADVSPMDVEEPLSVGNSSCQENVEADLSSDNLIKVSEDTQTEGTKSSTVANISPMDVEEPHSVGNSSSQEIVEADLPSENLINVSEDTQTEGTKSGSVTDVFLMDVEEPHSVNNSSSQEIVEADLPPENLLEVNENTQTDGTKFDEGEADPAHDSSAALKPSVVGLEE